MRDLFAAMLFAFCQLCFAQSWPVKPVRILVGYAPGGTADVSARFTSDGLSKELGQSVVVDNRPGGSGSIAIELLVRGLHDGYTIVVGADSSIYQPVLIPSLSYRAQKDLSPITILAKQPIIIVAYPGTGWKSVAELLNAAKARPGQIAYALSSAGGTQAVAAGIFFNMARVKLVPVPYKGGGQAVIDVLGGQVPLAVLGAPPVMPHLKTGKLNALAVTQKTRAKVFPDVPTLAELGYPEMDIAQWHGAVAPAGTPAQIVARLSVAYNKVLADPATRDRFFAAGLETVGGSPEEMSRRIAAEVVIWSKAAKEAGLVPD
jgi:tripartite-type tricarboxylate transporter receptor subunit TctC